MYTNLSPDQKANYDRAVEAFVSGDVEKQDKPQLIAHPLAISIHATGDDAVQSRDAIQATSLNHMILQRFVEELERRNATLQKVVLWLTVASLIGTIVQVVTVFY